MSKKRKLLECFNESKSSILEEEELRVWWEKEAESVQELSESLRVLLEEGRLGKRSVLCVGDKQTMVVYWLHSHVVSPSVQPPASTPLSARRGGKRSRFVSPLLQDSREKRVRLDVATDTVKGSLESVGEDGPSRENKEERRVLLAQLKESKEELRKLRMVKMHREKSDFQGLDVLTQQWREVSQEVVQSLLDSSTHQPRPTMNQLLNYLHIEPDLIHYSTEDESFY